MRRLMVIETEGAEFVGPRARAAGYEPLFVETTAGSRWLPAAAKLDGYDVLRAGAADERTLFDVWRDCQAESVLSLALLEDECLRDARLARLLAEAAPHVHVLASPLAAAQVMADKGLTKRVLRSAGFAVLPGVEAHDLAQASEAARRFGFPLVVKPRRGFVGQGLRFVRDQAGLAAAFQGRARACLVEPFVSGVEVGVEVLAWSGGAISQPPVCKGVTRANLFEHPAYRVRVCPWDDGAGMAARVRSLAEQMARVLGACGLVEMEFVVARGEALLMEVNPGPAGLSRLCSAAGGADSFALATAAAVGADPRAEAGQASGVALMLPIVCAPDAALRERLAARSDVAYVEPVQGVPTLRIRANLLLRGTHAAGLHRSLDELGALSEAGYLEEARVALGARCARGAAEVSGLNEGARTT